MPRRFTPFRSRKLPPRRLRTFSIPVSLLNGLLAWWSLNESSGNRSDASGNGITLEPAGSGVGSAAGKRGSAADFDGSDFLFRNGALFTQSPFTIACWTYSGSTADDGVVFAQTWAGEPLQQIIEASSGGYTVTAGTNLIASGIGISADTWTHVAFTNDGITSRVFINGAVANSGLDAPDFTNADELALGLDLTGRVDLCGVWGRLLTPSEIQRLYNGGAGLDYPF